MHVEKMDTKTSPVSPKCQRGSSFVVGNIVVLVNPLSATPFFSPLHGPRWSASWFTSRGVGMSPSPKFAARQAY
jgi:hypothetical protein